jgi:cytoskeleton protein RodZ
MVDKADNGILGAPSDAVAARAPAETVGQTLLKARTALGLTLEQCATDLRIEQPQLAALESDKFERIGVPVFVKGYLRQYGQRLGLDVRELLAIYYRQGNLQEIEIKPSRTIKLRDDRQVAGWVVAILVVVALAVFFAIWWFGDFQISTFIPPPAVAPAPAAQPRAELPQTPAPEAAVAPSAAAPAAEPVALPGTELQEPTPAPAEPPPAATAPPVARAAEAPAGAVPAVVAAVRPEAAAAESPPALDSYATDVELAFDQESWAEVVDARGERLFNGNGAKGRRVVLHGEPPFSVVLGNADGVRVQFDGGPYPIPSENRDGKRARFSLDISED